MEELLETLSGNVDPSSTPEATFKLVRAAVLACYREQASEVARLRHEGEELRSQVATLRAQLGGLRALVPALMKGETRSPVSVPEEEEVFGGIREGDDALLLRLKAAAQHEVDDARDDLESDKSGGKAAAALLAAEEAELSPRRASRSVDSVDCDRFRGLSLLGSMLTPGEIKVQDLPSVDASTAQKRLNSDDADRESRRGPREDKGKDEEDYHNRDDDNDLLRRLQEEALQEVDATADSVKLYQYSSSEPDGSNRHTRVSSQSQLRALSRGRSKSGGGFVSLGQSSESFCSSMAFCPTLSPTMP